MKVRHPKGRKVFDRGRGGRAVRRDHLMWQSSDDVHGPTRPGIFHVPHDPTELGRAHRYYITL